MKLSAKKKTVDLSIVRYTDWRLEFGKLSAAMVMKTPSEGILNGSSARGNTTDINAYSLPGTHYGSVISGTESEKKTAPWEHRSCTINEPLSFPSTAK